MSSSLPHVIRNSFYNGLPLVSEHPTHTLLKALRESVKDLATNILNVGCKINLEISSELSVPNIENGNNYCTINIPYLALLKPENIPDTFKEAGIVLSYERLAASGRVEEFYQWVRDFFQMPYQKMDRSDEYIIGGFLDCCAKPELLASGIRFFLGHELSHLFHPCTHYPSIKKYVLFFTLFLVLGIASCFFFYFKHWGTIKDLQWHELIAAGVSLLMIGIHFSYITRKSQAIEKAVDLHIARRCPNAKEGGAFLFKTATQYALQRRANSFFLRLFFNDKGNFRLNCTHPDDSDRAEYLASAET